jgi:hypothetical protein
MNASSAVASFLLAATMASSPSFARVESPSPEPQRFTVAVPQGSSAQLSRVGDKYFLSTSRPAGQHDVPESGAKQQRYEIKTLDCRTRQTGVTSRGEPHFAHTCK